MMNLIIMTISFTVAILLAGVIATAALLALMGNTKVIKWFTNYYMKQLEKLINNCEKDYDKEVDA